MTKGLLRGVRSWLNQNGNGLVCSCGHIAHPGQCPYCNCHPAVFTAYSCFEHAYSTNDPRKAAKHIQGHIIDLGCDLVAKALKARLGIPHYQKREPSRG